MALTPHRDKLRLFAICAALALVAAPQRFARLGALSFYGDEDLTALVARSVARGEGPRMPSGMEYRRALPYTWLAAGSARLFGETREWSYRLPSAVLATLTVPLLFLLGRWLIGEPGALVASLLLAFSAWHLVYARQARMYAPFLFVYIAAAFALLVWARGGKFSQLAVAVVAVAAATAVHMVGVLVVIFALLPIAFAGSSRVRPIAALGFGAAVGVATQMYERHFVGSAYQGWVLPPSEPGDAVSEGRLQFLASLPPFSAVLILAGAALGLWCALRSRPDDSAPGGTFRSIALFASAILAGALAGAGQLYGFALAALVFLLIHTLPRSALAKRVALPGALLSALIVIGALNALLQAGSLQSITALFEFPYPYALLFASEVPHILLLFGAATVWLALRAPRPEDHGLRIAALGATLPLAALGLSGRAPALRFAMGVYPFLLLPAGWALFALATLPQRWIKGWSPRVALVVAVLVVLSGLLGSHGLLESIRMARLEHGQPMGIRSSFAFRPDHAAAGAFVRRMRSPADVVIAEDATEQHWYAGGVDYWFRGYADARPYLYQARDGRQRNQYVGSAIAADPAVVDSVIARATGRVWLITAGETASIRSYYLSSRQTRWLDSLEVSRPAAFIGRDKATRVYCLNCSD